MPIFNCFCDQLTTTTVPTTAMPLSIIILQWHFTWGSGTVARIYNLNAIVKYHFGEIEASNIIYFIATFFHKSAILQFSQIRDFFHKSDTQTLNGNIDCKGRMPSKTK